MNRLYLLGAILCFAAAIVVTLLIVWYPAKAAG